MSLQGIRNLLGSTSPAASARNENARASDGSEANAPVAHRPLDALLEFLAASLNISIFELAGVLHNAKDYESLCSNEPERTLVRVWLQTQLSSLLGPAPARGARPDRRRPGKEHPAIPIGGGVQQGVRGATQSRRLALVGHNV